MASNGKYRLKLLQPKGFTYKDKIKLYQAKFTGENTVQHYSFFDGILHGYHQLDESWQNFSITNDLLSGSQDIYFSDIFETGQQLLITKNKEGINFFQYKFNQLNLLNQDDNFHDVYGWSQPENFIKFGYYYKDANLLGIMTKHNEYGIQFYAIMRNEILSEETPIWPLVTNVNILDKFLVQQTKFYTTSLERNGQDNIIIQSPNGLTIYKFNERKLLQQDFTIECCSTINSSDDKLYFSNLTGHQYQDIIYFNSTGLFLHQYNPIFKSYRFLSYHPSFSLQKGWTQDLTDTVKFLDINLDGREDMIFTGQQGISILSYNNYNNRWQSLLDNSQTSIQARNGKVVDVVSHFDDLTMFIYYQDRLHLAKIEEFNNVLIQSHTQANDPIPLVSKPQIVPQVLPLVEGKDTLFLRDQLDYSSVMDSVDRSTGTLKFMLPLVDIPNIATKLKIFYDGTASGMLGFGWSLPQNLIMLDHQGSIFIEDSKYYIAHQHVLQQLLFDSKNSTNNVYSFRLQKLSDSEQSDMKISYYKEQERWEISTSRLKQIYGKVNNFLSDPIQWELTWKNWRGDGSSARDKIQLPIGWYLSEVRDKHSNVLSYRYISVNGTSSGDNLTSNEVYLKQIADGEGNKISFKYSKVSAGESITKNKTSPGLKTSLHLSGYILTTPKYTQDIDFFYTTQNNQILLSTILQKNDLPALQFYYNRENLLEKVIFPFGAQMKYTYQPLKLPSEHKEKSGHTIIVNKNYKIHYGNGYTIVSYLNNNGHVELKIFDQEMTKELYSSSSDKPKSKLPYLGNNSIKEHDVSAGSEYIVVTLLYTNDKEIYLFHLQDGKLQQTPTNYKFSDDADVKNGNDYIIAADGNTCPVIIEWNKEIKGWTKTPLHPEKNWKTAAIAVFRRMFVVYDDEVMEVGYKDQQQKWQFKIIKRIPNLLSNMQETLSRFGLDDEVYKQLFYYSRNNILQISNNIMLLSSWGSEGRQFYSTLNLYLLDNKYDIILQKHQKISQDNIDDFSRELQDPKGNKFVCRYTFNNNKYMFFVSQYKGPAYDEIENQKRKVMKDIDDSDLPDTEKANHRIKTNEDVRTLHEKNRKSIAESWGKKMFLLDYAKYHAFLNSAVTTLNNYKFNFTGTEWEVENIVSKKHELKFIPLGKDYILDQENIHSSFKLYRQNSAGHKEGSFLKDLHVKHLNETLLRYPVYLASQEQGQQAQVIVFSKTGEISKTYSLPHKEKLSLWSGHQGIITESDSSSKNLIYFTFRPLLGIKDLLTKPAITQTVFNYDNNMKRLTGYDYDVSSALDNGNYYPRNTLIPGNDRKSFGWVEETIHENNTTKVIYNGQGEVIRTLNEKFTASDKDEPEDLVNKNSTLFDKMDKLPVARFFPYEITSGIVSYYGFEDYEANNNAGSTESKTWLFDETNIVRQSYSFTGNNYLHIKSGQNLVGVFHPKDPNITYVASTWIRPNFEIPQLGSSTPYLKIVAGDEATKRGAGVLSEIKLQSGGWYYLESIIDLYYIQLTIDNSEHKGRDGTRTNSSDSMLKLSVIVSPETNSTIDVDHIRFSPLNCRFQASTYNPVTKSLTQEIQYNGLIKRYIYDKYLEKIATINEYGQLTEFSTYTKASSSTGALQQQRSNIQIEAESGFYEEFSPDTFFEHWKIAEPQVFQISPGQLKHVAQSTHTVQLLKYRINKKSYGIRLYYALQTSMAFIQFNSAIKLLRSNESANLYLANKSQPVPLVGEILIVVEDNRVLVWVEGGLYIDTEIRSFNIPDEGESLINIEMKGEVKLREVMVFNKVNVAVTYFNGLGEKIQEVKLEDGNNSIVTGFLYDKLGRQSITTKPVRITNRTTILTYYPDLVLNSNPYSDNSVWNTGKLKGGETGNSAIIGEYDFAQTKYDSNPMDEECVVGLPGKEFSVDGPFSKRYDSTTNILYIKNHYPVSKGYRYKIEHKPGGVTDIGVFDAKNNQVVWYVHVPNNKDLLCTYAYDENNRLIKLLPPLYHEKAGTLFKLDIQNQTLTKEEAALENSLGTHIVYDDNGDIKTKTTPDSGKIENIYDKNGLLKFVVYYSHHNDEKVDNVLYFNYDGLYRLRSTGLLKSPPPVSQLLHTIHNNTRNYQEFYYSDADPDPLLRGRIRRTITYNHEQPFIEEFLLNDQKDTLNKRIIIPVEKDKPLFVEINKVYAGDKLKEVQYPVDVQNEPFTLTYEYNKLGKIKEIGVPGNPSLFFSFSYNPSGQVLSETHYPMSAQNFTRHYSYNSPGFLVSVKDRFLEEDLFYTEAGYGGYGHGDGTVTRTQFTATWHKYSTRKEMGLNENSFISPSINSKESKLCFNTLKQAGYLDDLNHQSKVFYPELDVEVPIVCSQGTTGRYIANILGKRGFPTQYGHVYDYGNHQELTKAKYFVGNEHPSPLQPDRFANIHALVNTTISQNIWQRLKSLRYLIEDHDKIDLSTAHGKRGKSFIRQSLSNDLKNTDPNYTTHLRKIGKLLGFNFSKKRSLSLTEFQRIFSLWKGSDLNARDKKEATDIYNMLQRKNYLQNPLSDEFQNALKDFDSSVISDIVRVILEHFAQELGEAEFDVESYGIDANGNHKHYYTGFDRYEISYQNNTNRIDSLKFRSYAATAAGQSYRMDHDSRGNVVQALHKGIKKIHYDRVLNRASEIELLDGRRIKFFYDSQGERILKKVVNSEGYTTKEVHYIRDEFGRSLVERELTFASPNQPPDLLVTVYVYGPRGLIGFIRRDEFYSVVTDHEHSVRLVVRSGEVVAAYDYLPYGNLMREFASYPEAHITYRYTGQEWDEELGLYNFHARFYDPSIGRFFQVDPKDQYYSPYKYGGNSPVSTIDPDGQFAFLIAIAIGALVGAYLGGAAANKTFNFTKWNWKSGKTWLGIIGGGVGGALLPVGFAGSVAAFGAVGFSTLGAYGTTAALGVAGAYLSTAAANSKWDFTKWDYSSPETWNAIFTGYAAGSGIAGGFRSVGHFYKSLTPVGKGLFIASTAVSGGGMLYIQGSMANWDFSKPEMWFGLLNVVTSATDLPMFLRGASRFVAKNGRLIVNNFKNIRRFISQEKNLFSHFSVMKSEWIPIVRATSKISSGAVITGLSMYLVGSAANEDFTNWNMTSVGTYQALINGLLYGGQLSSAAKNKFRTYRIKKKMIEGQKAVDAAVFAARTSVQEYENILDVLRVKLKYKQKSELPEVAYKEYEQMIQNVNQNTYSKDTMNRIKDGPVPNTAVAVGITDKYIISAFSSNEYPGLVMIFPHKKMSSATYRDAQPHKEFLDTNKNIAGRPVELSDNSARNKYLMDSIHETQEGIKQRNIKIFESEAGTLRQALDEFEGLGIDTKEKVIQNLENIIREHGYLVLGKKTIINELSQHVNEITETRVQEIKQHIKERNKVLVGILNQRKDPNLKKPEFKEEYDELSKQFENLKKEIADQKAEQTKIEHEINQNRNNIVEKMWKPLEDFSEQLTLWPPINCAEPHVFSAHSRIKEMINDSGGTFNDKSGDIKFMATYKIRDDFAPFERCDHCKITTAHVDNIITDPHWTEILNGNLLKQTTEEKLNPSIDRLYFLIPFNNMLNKTISHNNRKETDTKVKRRYVRQINTRDESLVHRSANKGFEFPDMVASKASKNPFYVSYIVDWIKEKCNSWLTYDDNSVREKIPQLPVNSDEPFSKSDRTYRMSTGMADVPGSLLLANVIVAKKFKNQLYTPGVNESLTYTEALAQGINITEAFEVAMRRTAIKYGLTEHTIDIDFVEVQNLVIGRILGCKLHEISGLLNSYVMNTYPISNLAPSQMAVREKFVDRMAKCINKFVNKSIEQLLDKGQYGQMQVVDSFQECRKFVGGTKQAGISTERAATEIKHLSFDKEY